MITSTTTKFGLTAAMLVSFTGLASAEEAAPRWPRQVYARPLTLPGSVFQIGLDEAANNDFSALSTRVMAGYGIDDKLEVTAYYAFATKELELKGSLDANLGYAAIRGAAGGRLEVVPRAQVGYSFLAEAVNPLALGAQVQFNVTDKLALITPGGQLSIALDGDPKPISLGLPVAVGFQATPELYLQLDTSLGTIDISDSANAFLFADTSPFAATAIYNVQQPIDVIASVGLNVTPVEPAGVGDTLTFLLGVRYYGGTL